MPSTNSPESAFESDSEASARVITEDIEKPSLDERSYLYHSLSNMARFLLVHDPNTVEAAVCVSVGAGLFNDPIGGKGIAHAVEHASHLGSKQFPAEDEYDRYIIANGGTHDAVTYDSHTMFYFSINARPENGEEPTVTNPSPLFGGLDRLSAFLADPLFLAESVKSALNSIQSEFDTLIQQDGCWAMYQLDGSLSNPNHPRSTSGPGNKESLGSANVQKMIVEFYEKFYSSNLMTVVIVCREPLDLLQELAIRFFSRIDNKNLPENCWTEPFTESELGIQWFAKPLQDIKQLSLAFPFINGEGLNESEPATYISHLLGHKGPGSIMVYLANRGWAGDIEARYNAICRGSDGTFEIKIELTDEGVQNYKKIVKVCFTYLALLRELPPQRWIFDEIKCMEDINFKFSANMPALDFAKKISAAMQNPLQRRWLVRGSLPSKFNAEAISNALKQLRPESLRLSVVSRHMPIDVDYKEEWMQEKWFRTEYQVQRIPREFMAELQAAVSASASDRSSELHLPHKNQFLPTKLEVEKNDVAEPAVPTPLLQHHGGTARIWYKRDNAFLSPKSVVIIGLMNPIVNATAKGRVKSALFINLVKGACGEFAHAAMIAGLKYNLYQEDHGLTLKMSGYNEKLPMLLLQLVEKMFNFDIQQDSFNIAKECLAGEYENSQLVNPFNRAPDYLGLLTLELHHTAEEHAAALQDITIDAVRAFKEQFFAQMYTEVYVHGNLHRDDVTQMTDLLAKGFKAKLRSRDHLPIIRSFALPPGSNFVYKRLYKAPGVFDHCACAYFPTGDISSHRINAMTKLAGKMLRQVAFHQLRTINQLGYALYAGEPFFGATFGLIVAIQSKLEPESIDCHFETTFVQLIQTLREMSGEEFECHKRSIISNLTYQETRLGKRAKILWTHICEGDYDFGHRQLVAAEVESLTQDEMFNFIYETLHPSSNSRTRVAIYIYSFAASERDRKIAEALKTAGYVNVPAADRKSLDLVRAHLQAKHEPTEADLNSVLALLKEQGLAQTVPPEDSHDSFADGGKSTLSDAQVVEDLRLLRSSFKTSVERPVKQLSEFQDIDAKV